MWAWIGTLAVFAALAIETTDLVFALDSIPAVFGVTRNLFVVFTSNAFAVLGLRALYFLLARSVDRFSYPQAGSGRAAGVRRREDAHLTRGRSAGAGKPRRDPHGRGWRNRREPVASAGTLTQAEQADARLSASQPARRLRDFVRRR
ncbi:MAG TPA: hypothetical protein VH307_01970 [Streptosporangiaceae bacterium]|nr:hypothetical protein [Streptosporangiaceae bacterium]